MIAAAALAAATLLPAAPAGAATRTDGIAAQPERDSAAAHRRARDLQSRFERRRLRRLPRTGSGGAPECDENIGRLCIWDDGADDRPLPAEPEAVQSARDELLAALDSLAALIPGDHWVFGQRARYLVEAERPGAAAALARRCRLPELWRCDAYLGYALHARAEIPAAEAAFGRALAAMPAARRAEWTDPGPLLDDDLRLWLAEQPDSAAAAARLWLLADPLFAAPGNDRWTGHLSRWVHAMSSERARNPHQLIWGDDLSEAVVRYGWPVAWERSWPRAGDLAVSVTGRDPPAALRTLPPVEALKRGGGGGSGGGRGAGGDGEHPDAVAWRIPEGHSPSAYLPPYLDTMAPLDGQVGRFWRPGGVMVAAEWAPPPRAGALEAGLFVEQNGAARTLARIARAASTPSGSAADPLPRGRTPPSDTIIGSPRIRTLRLHGLAPFSDWGVVSFEAWMPDDRRAHRRRIGFGMRSVPRGVLFMSDLMLLDAGAQPADFAEMIPVLRGSAEAASGEALGVALEVYGLRPSEAVGFNAWVESRGEGVFVRAARWLGFGGPREEAAVSWDEAGPARAEPLFRAFTIGLPRLDPGEYDLVVEVSVGGREPLEGRRVFNVR